MLAWMAWAVFVSVAVGLAAMAAERILRSRALPGRVVWATALAASVVLCAWALFRPAAPVAVDVTDIPFDVVTTTGTGPATSAWHAPEALRRADPFLATGWLASSAFLAVALFGGTARLVGRSRRWPVHKVGEGEVLVSEDFGPALLGLRTPRVVLPRWALGLDSTRLTMVVLHEEEHRSAGDAPLLLAATLALVCAPWNPALWWQLRRLRAAVELDCDARVVGRGADPRAYGTLLLELGSRVSGLHLPVAALSKPRSLLERRLKMIVRGTKRDGPLKTAVAAAAVVALTVVACETPPPTAIPVPTENDEFQAQELSEGQTTANVLIRGVVPSDGPQPIVFVDGVRVETVPADLDPDRILRIEVVKGEAAIAAFGPEAVVGAIQIFTKEGAKLNAVDEADNVRFGPEEANPRASKEQVRDFRLQALAGQDLQIFVNDNLYGGDLEDIDKKSIDRMEVVKGEGGKATTLYIYLR